MSRNVCARCAKPVYFAERKTSLGRDWHPTCLRCVECGRVLSPGQHAEHKGNPYCHTPCYNALFGPSLLGYGSNLASPANFAKKDNAAEFGHDYDDDVYKREIYSNSRHSAAAIRRQKQRQSAPPSIIGHDFSPSSPSSGTSPAQIRGRGDALPSTHSVDNLDAKAPRAISVNSSPSLPISRSQAGGQTDSSVDGHASNAKSSNTPSAKVVVHHSRSKSEHMFSSTIDNQSGCSSRVGEGQDGPLERETKSPQSNSTRRGSDPSSEEFPQKRIVPESGYLVPGEKRDDVTTASTRDILEKVESFNSHYEGKVHHQMTVEQMPSGEVKIRGPLRIYWGLSRPIQLRQCDDVPAPPISKWRHSLCANLNEGVGPNSASPSQKLSSQGSPNFLSPNRPLRGIDDCVLLSPSSSADEVVMRRQKVRKFNTVAYRSDAPTRWKRASINGHIFNYDTSVFTPVLGSSTSVIADSTMTSPLVIKTLLEKFKVENRPGEYLLSVVTEKGDQTQERLLGETDRPLLERLQLGADDQYAKIFLKERRMEPEAMVPDTVKLPIMEEEEEETLPAEVEQLMILPVAVLKGIMVKYHKDEEKEVQGLRKKYELVKRKIRQRLEDMKTA